MNEARKSIIDANISALFRTSYGLHDRFAYQAHELISGYSDERGGIDIDVAYNILNSAYELTLGEERNTAFLWIRTLTEVLLDTLGSEAVRDKIRSILSSTDRIDERAIGKVSYLRNKFTEKAFDKFARLIYDPKILNAGSFEDSCEDVYNGICEYCILPIDNSVDGRLSAFYALISKYDLHIIASTPVKDENVNTTLALISRDTDFLKLGDSLRGRMLQFEFSTANTSDISGIISFASSYGMKLIRIHSIKNDEDTSFTLLFSVEGVQLRFTELLSLCLSAIYPSFNIIGFYRQIN